MRLKLFNLRLVELIIIWLNIYVEIFIARERKRFKFNNL